MNEYRAILEHRIRQFAYYLRLMRTRQRGITSGHSFIIFAEGRTGTAGSGDQLVQSAAKSLKAVTGYFDRERDTPGGPEDVFADLPDAYWREDDSSHRFIQLSFNPRFFDIDMPNTTLYRAEAEEILRRRPGFFYVKDRPSFMYPSEEVPTFNPVRKAYVYGDDQMAAEDMAFVWFQVWKFPVDWRFYVSAAAFHESTNWERDWPLDAQAPVGD